MSRLFPLCMDPFEEFMLSDDLPGYPKSFVLELMTAGEVDKEAFDRGLVQAVSRHPLFTALVKRRIWRRPKWIHAPAVVPQVIWSKLGEPIEILPDEGIDLSKEVGVRFYIQVGGGRSRIIVLMHHCCCDGIGAIQFLSDVFTGYARHYTPDAVDLPDFPHIEPKRLLRRGRFEIHRQRGRQRRQFRRMARRRIMRLLFSSVAPLAVPSCSAPGRGERITFPGILTQTLEKWVYNDLRRLSRQRGVTVNDLLIRELFLAMRHWNRKYAPGGGRKRLAVMVPTNLRTHEEDGMPAANAVSLTWSNHHVDECDEPDRLLQSIHDEYEFMKNTRFSALLIKSLRRLRWIPGFLGGMARHGKIFSTAVFSNIGNPWRIVLNDYPKTEEGHPILGNLVLEDVNSASPLPTKTHAAFTVWHTDDKLRVGLRADSRVFSQEHAQALLETFAGQILSLVERQVPREKIRIAA